MKDFDLRKYLAENELLNEADIPRRQYQLGKRALGELVSEIMPIIVNFIETNRMDTVSSGMRGQLTRKGESKEEFLKHQIEFLGDRISNEINNRMEELANKYSANLNENKLLKEEEFVFPMEFQLKEDVNYESFGVHGGILYKGAYVKDRIESTYDEALYVNVEAEHEARLDKDDIRNLRRLGATLFYR